MKQFVIPGSLSPAILAGKERLRLEGKDFHYLVRVRRMETGDSVPAITPDGRRFRMEICSIGTSRLEATLGSMTSSAEQAVAAGRPATGETAITLMAAVTKGRNTDLTVRQAVEAGAAEFWPLLTEYCQVKYRNPDDRRAKKDRWDRIAVEALQQCGGGQAMKIAVPSGLEEALESWGERGPVFFLHEKALESPGLFARLGTPVAELGIIVGPEGGLSSGETRLLQSRGAWPIHLGDRVLRAETAALYGLAAVATIIREKSEWHPA